MVRSAQEGNRIWPLVVVLRSRGTRREAVFDPISGHCGCDRPFTHHCWCHIAACLPRHADEYGHTSMTAAR
ncbi:uncharacterized protein P174DRAFT_250029 [Aspergillus novofumigatus IBT 16806]|uniref:Uncharacterized protein n=1 Tax=Aspergillus novofumigatus (strain IBT 16806) TaxID=1392255 RepID=A0A2I1C2C7_ASPN1|nr:uncharacterized protein P174DRAFT_250029 [Aspergillus novofumigatus IBT 16806]PKX91797.1 hypothetical protein P174DRAFT_250029 [Aspergillus novofumigatus IBT 16806]